MYQGFGALIPGEKTFSQCEDIEENGESATITTNTCSCPKVNVNKPFII